MAKKFPCPYCKGKGHTKEIVLEETKQGPTYECIACDGNAMIEIGSLMHHRLKAFKD